MKVKSKSGNRMSTFKTDTEKKACISVVLSQPAKNVFVFSAMSTKKSETAHVKTDVIIWYFFREPFAVVEFKFAPS